MNFDELQKQWNNQSTDDVQINKESLHKTKSIIDKINNNFKNEFIFWIISIIIIAFYPCINRYGNWGNSLIIYYFLFLQMLLSGIFYYKRFYIFRKLTKKNNFLQSKTNIIKIYYELKFAIESYKTACYLLIPQTIGLVVIIKIKYKINDYAEQFINFKTTWENNPDFVWKTVFSLILLITFIIVFSEWIINNYYKKYLKQLKKVIEDFEE